LRFFYVDFFWGGGGQQQEELVSYCLTIERNFWGANSKKNYKNGF
jgi:hypothetical protein